MVFPRFVVCVSFHFHLMNNIDVERPGERRGQRNFFPKNIHWDFSNQFKIITATSY